MSEGEVDVWNSTSGINRRKTENGGLRSDWTAILLNGPVAELLDVSKRGN
jgi:hypothetical protein